ncbi:MAG: HEAT repeat domain-containing protein [Gemmataceae bacterium]
MFPSLMCATFLGTVGAEAWFPPLPVEDVARNLIQLRNRNGIPPTTKSGLGYIAAAGPRAYPALRVVLEDPWYMEGTKDLALRVLCGQPYDRSMFVDPAVKLLGHEERFVRQAALSLLSEIGGGEQVETVFPLLYHEDVYTRKPAIKAIGAMGDVQHVPVLAKYLSPLPPNLILGGTFHTAVQDAIKELEKKPAPKTKSADKK